MVSKEEVKIPLFYLYIHEILSNKFTKIIGLKEFTDFMHEWRIPKVIRIAMVQELENMKLVTRLERNIIQINNPSIKLNTTTEMYEYVGLLPNSE
jgi:hypothetical protein